MFKSVIFVELVAAITAVFVESRLPLTANEVFEHREDYINQRNRIAWNFYNPRIQSEQVDLIINYDLTGRESQPIELPRGQKFMCST